MADRERSVQQLMEAGENKGRVEAYHDLERLHHVPVVMLTVLGSQQSKPGGNARITRMRPMLQGRECDNEICKDESTYIKDQQQSTKHHIYSSILVRASSCQCLRRPLL